MKIRPMNDRILVVRVEEEDLDAVIRAAREAKVSDDIISRCCVDGCAERPL